MTNPQGTVFETEIVNAAKLAGVEAGRYPKMASPGEPDVWIGNPSLTTGIPVVFWKRLVGVKKDGRRKPDGERVVVILSGDDFLGILATMNMLGVRPNVKVQAKWTSALNVTRVLYGLRKWLEAARMKSA